MLYRLLCHIQNTSWNNVLPFCIFKLIFNMKFKWTHPESMLILSVSRYGKYKPRFPSIFSCLCQVIFIFDIVHALSCYQCIGTHPGCTLYDMNWIFQTIITCSRTDDRCVKVSLNMMLVGLKGQGN